MCCVIGPIQVNLFTVICLAVNFFTTMSQNKNALVRYHVLDRCFQNTGRQYFIDDLVEACNAALENLNPDTKGISKRQIFADIKFMQSDEGYAAPIQINRHGKKTTYRYSDKTYSIHKQVLNAEELSQLKLAIEALRRFKGMPQFDWIEELILKVNMGVINTQSSKTIICFDSNPYLKGLEHLSSIFDFIRNEQVLLIEYRSLAVKRDIKLIIHPYYLREYNKRWFLMVRVESTNEIKKLPLDRILTYQPVNIPYKAGEIDFEEYFEDFLGLSRPNPEVKVEKIQLLFNIETAPYILSKPIHGSQKILSNDTNGLKIQLSLVPNYYLESLLLSYAENVQIIAPESLRKKIHKRHTLALEGSHQ